MEDKPLHCPACSKILFKEAYLDGKGRISTNCYHCGKLVRVIVNPQQSILIAEIKDHSNKF